MPPELELESRLGCLCTHWLLFLFPSLPLSISSSSSFHLCPLIQTSYHSHHLDALPSILICLRWYPHSLCHSSFLQSLFVKIRFNYRLMEAWDPSKNSTTLTQEEEGLTKMLLFLNHLSLIPFITMTPFNSWWSKVCRMNLSLSFLSLFFSWFLSSFLSSFLFFFQQDSFNKIPFSTKFLSLILAFIMILSLSSHSPLHLPRCRRDSLSLLTTDTLFLETRTRSFVC